MRQGFTLIELVIVLGLVVVMTGMIVPSFMKANQLQKVVTEKDKLKETYIQARDNALSGKNSCAPGVGFLGWRVVVVSPNIRVEGICGNGNYPAVGSTFSTRSDTVLTGITVAFTNLGAPANGVLFRPGGQGIYPPLSSATLITVRVSDTHGNSRNFTISGFGNIQ
jgi:prepilin-type N-terminal cleavage/methylation domain-containing protein